MAVTLVPVRSRRELRRFIELPEALHQGHRQWVPPLYGDEWAWHSSRKNLAFRYCEVIRALARKDGAWVGRVMGIVNHRHNQKIGEAVARFSGLECVDDPGVCHALLDHVEGWARGLGMGRVVGPMGFTDQDPQGFMIEGFDETPTIVNYYNFPFLSRLLEAEGYSKEVDYFVYHVPMLEGVPPLMEKVAGRVERRGFREVGLRNRREAGPYVLPVLRLLNETFVGIYGFSPMDDEELRALARRYIPLLDFRFVKVVEKEGELVGFMIGMPDLHEGIQKARGRLLPGRDPRGTAAGVPPPSWHEGRCPRSHGVPKGAAAEGWDGRACKGRRVYRKAL